MTYAEYSTIGGDCPEVKFAKFDRIALAFLTGISKLYNIAGDLELAEVLLVDYYYKSEEAGNVVSVSVGSYSETRKVLESSPDLIQIRDVLDLHRKRIIVL